MEKLPIIRLRDSMRKMRTKKEINHRIYEIFNGSKPESVSLTDVESARVKELEWVLGLSGKGAVEGYEETRERK